MQKILIVLILTLVIISCINNTDKTTNNKPLTETQLKEKLSKLKLDFNEPVLINSSVYVMYPLILKKSDEEEESSFSSSRYKPTVYWNIIFYNTETGEYHLLDDTLKMAIYSYNSRTEYTSSLSSKDFYYDGYNQVNRLIYFSIRTKDFNNDGKLNSNDPNYLFITDKAGGHFKQISPNNMNVESWKIIENTNKILLLVTKDTNGDKYFNYKDETFPLLYDMKKNTTSSEIFDNDFKTELKKQLDKQWSRKE